MELIFISNLQTLIFLIPNFDFFTIKKETTNIIKIGIYIIHKNGNKNMSYRKIVTSLYNIYSKPVVYCRKKSSEFLSKPDGELSTMESEEGKFLWVDSPQGNYRDTAV